MAQTTLIRPKYRALFALAATLAWSTACQRAVDAPLNFRALGQEPFWRLDIDGGNHIRFERLGETPVVTPVPEAQTAEISGARTYHAINEANDLRLVIEPVPCTDTMSGQSFETTVTVTLNQQDYRGCGGPLK